MTTWFDVLKIEKYLDLEIFIVMGLLLLILWGIYKLLLKSITEKRHRNLRQRFFSFWKYFFISGFMASVYWIIKKSGFDISDFSRFFSYWALITLYIEAFFIVRGAQISLYIYLFYSHLSVGVPRLIANSFTFVFGAIVFLGITSDIFSINVSNILATSAIFSVVLGLALQDTLGNFFSGFALQLDQPYRIGDWVEVTNGQKKWQGQIQEINWRATLMLGFMEELISIPNKMMAQSQVIILSHENGQSRNVQVFKIRYNENIDLIKMNLLDIFLNNSQVLKTPPPRALIIELNESWISLKVFYSVAEFGSKFRVGDQLLSECLNYFKQNKIEIAPSKLDITYKSV